MTKVFSFFIVGSIVFLSACGKDEVVASIDCIGTTPTYKNNIAAIYNASCATVGCHNAATKAEGIDLSTYAAAKSATQNTKVLQSIKHESGVKAMPLGGTKLSDATIKLVQCWMQNGYPE